MKLDFLGEHQKQFLKEGNYHVGQSIVNNSIDSIFSSAHEIAMLSKRGAGTASDFDRIIEKDTEISENFYSNSKLDWIRLSVNAAQKVSQGHRRGYNTPFLSIEDKEFFDLLDAVSKNNPDKNDPLRGNTVGIKLPYGFMDKVLSKDKESQRRWMRLLRARKEGGDIYIAYVENMNKNCSPVYITLKQLVEATNMCVETSTPTYDDKTFVCVLSAINLVHWDVIKEEPQIIKDLVYFADIMNEEYIYLGSQSSGLEKAVRSAREKRDIGIGALGLHSLLQSRMLVFGGLQSRHLNKEIFSFYNKYAIEASEELADLLGPAPLCEQAGVNRRNVSLMMLAPNKSTSFIHGAHSLGIEPYFSNYFTKKLAKIQVPFKNPYLKALLEYKGFDNFSVWKSIMDNLGSVSHLGFLTQHEKDVFKTFGEISPKDIIDLAADRQVYIDMSQSLNLMNRPNYTMKDLHQIHKYAYDRGIKTLYYFYPQAHASLEMNGEAWDACASCSD